MKPSTPTSVPTEHAGRPRRSIGLRLAAVVLAALLGSAAVACTDDPSDDSSTTAGEPTDDANDDPGGTNGAQPAAAVDCAPEALPEPIEASDVEAADTDGIAVTLAAHDSFAVSDGLFDDFTAETGVTVEVLTTGDAGSLVSQAILSAGNPVADVLFGIDTTFLCRGTGADIFVPYEASGIDSVPDEYRLDPNDLVTPIDVGDVCLNYSAAAFEGEAAPATLDDVAGLADGFITSNPESSSPGFAFLLATIAAYGEDGWEAYWSDLREGGLEVVSSWEDAYYGPFDAGSGDRTIVTSYASSPVADVLFSDPPRDEPAIGVVADSCFRQVEFAGILRGTDHPEAAAKLIDFMLSPTFQEDIPLNMFVEPVSTEADLPELFEQHRTVIDDPLTLTPAEIEAGREAWLDRWTEIVLR